ncbi:MAG: MarR family transcriptional regulator [Chloroflexota bacterium]
MNDIWEHNISISAVFTIFMADRSTLERLDLRLEPLGLSSAKLWPMAFVASANQPVTITELAECIGTTKSNMTAMVDRLEASGFVTRTRSTEDRRTVRIELTELGEQQLQVGVQVMKEVNETLRALFSPEEWANFHEYMQRVIDCSQF